MAVEIGNLKGTNLKVVGDEFNVIACFRVMVSNHSDRFWVEFLRLVCSKLYGKVTADSCAWFKVMAMVYDLVPHIVFGTTYPICISFMKAIQCKEIDVCLIHHVERKCFRINYIQLVAVMPFSICDMDTGRNTSTKIQESMHLDCALAVLAQSPCCQDNAC